MKQTSFAILGVLALAGGLAFQLSARAQSTGFTYQGFLLDNGGPANGAYDLTFTLFNASSGGSTVGASNVVNDLGVTNGLFTVALDFGSAPFDGGDRWVQVAVRPGASSGDYTPVTPRQPITSTPYAIRAANFNGQVAASQLTGTISSNNIGAGSITTVMLANGAVGSNQLASGAVTTGALADSAVTAAKVATVSNWFALTITNPSPAIGDQFGSSVAAVGPDRMLIGARQDDTGATDAGAAYLFSINGTLLSIITNPAPAAGDSFGNSLAAVGSDRVLIGAYLKDVGASDAGAAYLFSTNGALLTTFTNPTPASSDFFGFSVAALGSDRALIGAFNDDTGATDAGAAYLFGTNGALLLTFTNPTPAVSDNFGYSVAAVGSDRLLIGAPFDNTGANDAGAAYLYDTNGMLLKTFTNPVPVANDQFGKSLAAVGTDRALIGFYLFDTNGTVLTTFSNPAPAANDHFGRTVAAVGTDRVLIGAENGSTGASQAGAAYLFSTNGTLLAAFTNPTPAVGDHFGSSLTGVGSDRVLVGTPFDDTGATDSGAAYLFSVETYTPGLVAEGVRSGGITSVMLADGAVTAAKIGGVLLASQIPNLDASKITTGTLAPSTIGAGTITASQLAAGAAASNLSASGQSAVPGGGMILSSNSSDANLAAAGYVKLGALDPGDVWEQRASGSSPAARGYHTAVWTGSEMIIWGGFGGGIYWNNGARFNPTVNAWNSVTTTGGPSAGRYYHTAVWTGGEMIVWGGVDCCTFFNDGARYNPAADTWSAMTTSGAATARAYHTAVWTGSDMIVWGGFDGTYRRDGARYNPTANSWSAVNSSGAPGGRCYHTAVWTGSRMIVWGGSSNTTYYADGGNYLPASDSWSPVTTFNAPAGRGTHSAVWSGTEMIVWGGSIGSSILNSGGRYNPNNPDLFAWTAMSANSAPAARTQHTSTWTGTEMIVWGGYGNGLTNLNDGARYNPTTDLWSPTQTNGAPAPRAGHSAVLAGGEMIVWGGSGNSGYLGDGGRYTPTMNTWSSLSNSASPAGRSGHSTVWTGSEMIIWGGSSGAIVYGDGGRYSPTANNWTPVTTNGAPSARDSHTAVWTGNEMIVWGGENSGTNFSDGGRYSPAANAWTATTTNSAPGARAAHTAVWTGTEMIIWGGAVGGNQLQ